MRMAFACDDSVTCDATDSCYALNNLKWAKLISITFRTVLFACLTFHFSCFADFVFLAICLQHQIGDKFVAIILLFCFAIHL